MADMRVAGIEVPSSAIAELARLLDAAGHAGFAQRAGIAVDTGQRELLLAPSDVPIALSVLGDSPLGLPELRGALVALHGRRAR